MHSGQSEQYDVSFRSVASDAGTKCVDEKPGAAIVGDYEPTHNEVMPSNVASEIKKGEPR